jgi:hypothetical protein
LSYTSEIEVERKRSWVSEVIPGIDEKGILAEARIAQVAQSNSPEISTEELNNEQI